jgi:hypothetical protein
MDRGVYYRDTILNSWNLFNAGLPNAVIRQLKIQQAAGKLRASTYGRGVWESGLYVNASLSAQNVGQANKEYSLKISPNPTNGNFEVTFYAASRGDYELQLRNYIGQLVYSETLTGVSGLLLRPFNMSGFGKGVYLISLISSRGKNLGRTTEKIVVY